MVAIMYRKQQSYGWTIARLVRVTGEDGTLAEIPYQVQLYTTNDLLLQPLVSPALAYLGGLLPLFFVASDRKVLRDEIVYTAHRAANPEKYPVSDAVKKLYPTYEGIESRAKPTTVHLQIYDDTAHVIPQMFIATKPVIYCYRAFATFIKYVTDMPPTATLQRHKPLLPLRASDLTPGDTIPSITVKDDPQTATPHNAPTRPTHFSRMTSSFRRGSSLFSRSSTENKHEAEDANVLAGDPVIYHGGWAKGKASPEHDSNRNTMIRERVATNGIVRPLEPERDISALNIDPTTLGIISARWAQVYLAGVQRHEKKYASSIWQIEQHRKRVIALLHSRTEASQEKQVAVELEGDGWSIAWALDDADERPPPSSLVAQCDMAEALALAQSAAAATKRKRNARLALVHHRSLNISLGNE